MNEQRDLAPYACGDRIAGKYQLLRPIGAGGMGVVWVAHNLVLDVHVALKLIRGSIAGPGAAARLLREARSAARIAHTGVVRVFDFGTTARHDPFIVMELLEGETLRDVFDRERFLTPLRAVSLLLPVADALGALADVGIVHRDLKPDNVILVKGDEDRVQPKLVDFGVAILPGTDRLTWAGLLVGTPDYLAPEQADGGEVDHRADVWAFSVVLFEAITGRRPFTGETVTELINDILDRPAPSITSCGVSDEELASIVARGLEKSPDRRWSTIRALAAALATWARARGLLEDVTGAAVRGGAAESLAPRPASSMRPVVLTPVPPSAEAKTEVAPRPRRRADGKLEAGKREPELVASPSVIPPSIRDEAQRASKPTRLLPAWNEGDPSRARESASPAPVPSERNAPHADAPEPGDAPEVLPAASGPASWMRTAAVALLLTLATILVVLVLRKRSAAPASELGTSASGAAASTSAQDTATASAPSEPPPGSAAPRQDNPKASSSVPVLPSGAAVLPSSRAPREVRSSSPNVAKTSAPRLEPAAAGRVDDLKDPYKKK